MAKTQAKQIYKLVSGYLRMSSLTALGTSIDITSALTTALATASYNSQPIALAPSASNLVHGVAITSPANRVNVYNTASQQMFLDSGEEVYGRLTYSSGTISGATNATPIVVTTNAAHGLVSGQPVTISGVVGNTAANGTFYVNVLTTTTFALYSNAGLTIPVIGNGVYSSGGTLNNAYILSFVFKNLSNVEIPHNFTASILIDMEFVYRFYFNELPTDFAVGLTTRNVFVDEEGGGTSGTPYIEVVNVSGSNTLANLTYLPVNSSAVTLYINTKPELTLTGTPSFTMSGTGITWNPSNAGYNIDVSDVVIAKYTTNAI